MDSGDTFLDTDRMEIDRGITVFSKEARFRTGDLNVTLVDTPGHADFSAEMERALSVLDLALLVVSGAEGVQSHTITLMKLFKAYGIPVVIFVMTAREGRIICRMRLRKRSPRVRKNSWKAILTAG